MAFFADDNDYLSVIFIESLLDTYKCVFFYKNEWNIDIFYTLKSVLKILEKLCVGWSIQTMLQNLLKLSSNGLLFIFEAYSRAKQQVIQSQGDLCKKMKTAANQGGKK